MPKPQLVAVDTNLVLLLAKGDDLTQDAFDIIRSKIQSVSMIVPPTALEELAFKARSDPDQEMRKLAVKAVGLLRGQPDFQPAHLTALQEALVEQAGRRLYHSALLPYAERNDAWIITEAAVLNCVLLVSNDSHLLDVDHRRLGLLFREMDLPVPIIVSPRELVEKFFC